MAAKTKNDLIAYCLKPYLDKFYYFFHDIQSGREADKVLVRKIITKLDCEIFTGCSKIIGAGDDVGKMYFILKGTVYITDSDLSYNLSIL